MRILICLALTTLLLACSGKSPHGEENEVITRVGVITSKQDVDLAEAKKDTRVNTSVYASVSTGGRVSIGLGFMLSPFLANEIEPVRYQVLLQDGGEMTIYHDSRDFEVDDCVEIRVFPDEDENPPTMKRSKGAC